MSYVALNFETDIFFLDFISLVIEGDLSYLLNRQTPLPLLPGHCYEHFRIFRNIFVARVEMYKSI